MSIPAVAPDVLPARVLVSPDVLWHDVEGQVVLLDLRGQRYYSLDDVGGSMWKALCESPDVRAAVRALLAKYDVDEPQLCRDLATLLERLTAAGLIVVET